MPLSVMPLAMELVPEVARLESLLYPDPFSADHYYASLQNPADCHLVLLHDHELLGWLSMTIHESAAHIETVALAPGRSGHGLGSLLLSHAVQWAYDHDVGRMYSEILWTNLMGVRLFRKFHFHEREVPPSPHWPGGVRFDALITSLRGVADALVARAERDFAEIPLGVAGQSVGRPRWRDARVIT